MANAIQEYGPYRRKSNIDPLFVTGVGATAVVLGIGGVAHALKSDHHPRPQPTPNEKHGDHQGAVHNTVPGTGAFSAKSHDFHVTQPELSGINTAVAVEKTGDVPVHPIDLDQTK